MIQLIPNARDAWRFWSVRFAAALVAWELTPADYQAALLGLLGIPADVIPGVLAALSLASRLIQQPALHEQPKDGA